MSKDFVMCARAVKGGQFISEPGKSLYLQIPQKSSVPLPEHKISPSEWVKKLRDSAVWRSAGNDPDPNRAKDRGDILVFIHGYNNDQKIVIQRHRQLKGANKQKALKFHGILANLLSRKAYRRFSISQILAAFRGGFLRAYNPMESTIFSSEKSYSPCKLKWLHRITESFRMASMSSFLRSSLLSSPSSFVR